MFQIVLLVKYSQNQITNRHILIICLSRYSSLPKKKLLHFQQVSSGNRKATIAQYFRTVQCLSCASLTPLNVCEGCQRNPPSTLVHLTQLVKKLEKKHYLFKKVSVKEMET